MKHNMCSLPAGRPNDLSTQSSINRTPSIFEWSSGVERPALSGHRSKSIPKVRCPKNEALSNSTPVTAVTSFESRHVGTLPRSLTFCTSPVCRSGPRRADMREDAHGTKHIPTAIPTPQFVVTGESVILKAASNSDTPMAVNLNLSWDPSEWGTSAQFPP